MAEERFTRRSNFATPLHKAVEAATKPAFKKHGIAESRLITEWATIAGEVLAGKTLPKRLVFPKGQRDNGTLHLTVAPGWALEVQHLEPIILEKIATFFGYRAVAKIHMTQAPLPIKAKPKPKKDRSPLPAEEQKKLSEVTAGVEDAELKKLLETLGESILREKRR
jgi:hypothetical protein